MYIYVQSFFFFIYGVLGVFECLGVCGIVVKILFGLFSFVLGDMKVVEGRVLIFENYVVLLSV